MSQGGRHEAGSESSHRGATTGVAQEPVIVYNRWCKGCSICVEFCPKKVLALSQEGVPVAVVVNPQECTRCRLCEVLCPDFAITVIPREPKAAGRPAEKAEGEPLARERVQT